MKTKVILLIALLSVLPLFGGIQYAGGTNVNTTIAADTRTLIVDNLKAQLVIAGWTVTSGASQDWLLTSATTPTANNSIQVRLYDSGSGNCAQIFLRNAAGSKISRAYYLLPAASKVFKVLANKYQFFVYTAGSSAAREFVAAGVPYIPAFLQGVITGDFGWIWSNSNGDADATARASPRTQLDGNNGGSNNASGIVNSNLYDGSGSQAASIRFVFPHSALVQNETAGYRWHDSSLIVSEPLISWGLVNTTDEALIRGQLWDAIIINDSFAGDTSITLDSKTWTAVTGSNSGSGGVSAKGTLFVYAP